MAKKKLKTKFDKKDFLKVLGRIKYMQQSGMDMPPPYTKRMLETAAEHKIDIDKVKPVKVDLGYLDQKSKRPLATDAHRLYEYYFNGEYVMTGTKKEISAAQGVSVYMVEKLSSLGKEMNIGRGSRGGGDTHSCKCLGTIGELRKAGKLPDKQRQDV